MNFVLGDNRFNTPDSRGKLGKETIGRQEIRWQNQSSTGNALTTLGGVINVNLNFPVVGLERFVELVQINVYALFNDAGVAAYNVSEYCIIYTQTTLVNRDNANPIYLPFNTPQPLDMLLNLDSQQRLSFSVLLHGGSVQRITGVTPAVGDNVDLYLSIAYKA
jgi:hypothetical protein